MCTTPKPASRALGLGLDLVYGDPHGLAPVEGSAHGLAPRLRRFLERRGADFSYAFFSFQPRDRGVLELADYAPTWDRIVDTPGVPDTVALHHTLLNLGSIDGEVDRGRLLDFTNALCDRYGLAWVNEDLGIWSIGGRRLPYPLPPVLTEAGLESAVRHVQAVQAGLDVPLVVEFPGFSAGTNVVLGDLHAYDYFRRLVEACEVAVALDTGHLLSYQWWLGARGPALLEDLDRLPLAACFEIHLSGCAVLGERFVDAHHGILLDEQLELLELLLARCPGARRVAYEDPRVAPDGRLPDRARPGFDRLRTLIDDWSDHAEQ